MFFFVIQFLIIFTRNVIPMFMHVIINVIALYHFHTALLIRYREKVNVRKCHMDPKHTNIDGKTFELAI